MLDDIDRKIINGWQGGFPLTPRPFAEVAQDIGLSEDEAIERIRALREANVISRFGPMFNADALGGAFCLCAMAVPEERWENVVEAVNARIEVAHNYQREHRLNMWFVLASDRAERISEVCAEIEQATRLRVFAFPKLREFFVEFRVSA
ncbi:AsnC family transcriptional regulator [Rhodoblastus sp.]|uniref:Lrp/AsnC family transcriptional regulator n=1 Tax=Rhodoblastus sp. TaxID=1962975 RepID=UPI0026303A07|nr:AsnC family transcriptional regulator [Rhodoblastus sp.]